MIWGVPYFWETPIWSRYEHRSELPHWKWTLAMGSFPCHFKAEARVGAVGVAHGQSIQVTHGDSRFLDWCAVHDTFIWNHHPFLWFSMHIFCVHVHTMHLWSIVCVFSAWEDLPPQFVTVNIFAMPKSLTCPLCFHTLFPHSCLHCFPLLFSMLCFPYR